MSAYEAGYSDGQGSMDLETTMGDMADYANGQGMVRMALDRPTNRFKLSKTCRYCGKKNLVWKEWNGRWLLHTVSGTVPHQCHNRLEDAGE